MKYDAYQKIYLENKQKTKPCSTKPSVIILFPHAQKTGCSTIEAYLEKQRGNKC